MPNIENLTHLPHIKNVKAGIDKQDPVHGSLFEVYIELPSLIASMFKEDAVTLTQQVKTVSGINALQMTTGVGSQRFLGADASYLNPVLDQTFADIDIAFNLNLRDVTDNWVLKIFKAWENLSYDLTDGTRGIKADYISDHVRIAQANRNGMVWRSVVFHNIMLTGLDGLDSLDYTQSEALDLTAKFRADYWEDELA